MGRTARSMPPNLSHAPAEEETLAQWLRRQRHADRKPIPRAGITQTAPIKKTTPGATDAVKNTKR